MIEIPYLSAARFSGEDAGIFLQSQLSADIEALKPGSATFACYCTPKGKVLGLMNVLRAGDDFQVIANAELLPAMIKRLQMYVFRSRVKFAMENELQVCGDGDAYHVEKPATGQKGDIQGWKAAELRRGVCWLAAETSEKFIPQMLGFDQIGAVSFSKGCYPGQEIVARAKYLGKVKRKPLLIEVENLPEPAAGERARVLREGQWSDATLVDSAGEDGGARVLFLVAAAEPESAVEAIEIGGENYRCATM
jgi:folate-binding protein YgfZ